MKQQIYQICDASYDPLLRQFVREDGHVETIAPLEGKVFLFLLENAGECIERGLIFDRCWGNVIVSEQALTNVISKIRKTLSRVTCGCATIRTVSKTGYSLEIDDSSKFNITEIASSKATIKVLESSDSKLEPQSSVTDELLVSTSASMDELPMAPSVTESVAISDPASASQQTIASNCAQNTVGLVSSKTATNDYLIKAGYLIALICLVVTAFNLFRTYSTPQPYFIDKTEYRDNVTGGTNHYFFHIVHNEAYALPAITQKLIGVIPSHCNVDVFVRIYPSVDQPESDALYMLIQKKNGEALNYGASIFNIESSFESFAQYMEKRTNFCD